MSTTISGSSGVGGTFATGAPREQEKKKLEAFRNQLEELAEIMSGKRDSVEISDEARSLSNAARENTPRAAGAHAVDTREAREETAKDYNGILEDLRAEYGEEEAMRRFDTFMESEGFERVTGESHGMSASGGLSGLGRVFTGLTTISSAGLPHIGRSPITSNMSASSKLMGTLVNGEVRYFAETYANFGANAHQDVLDALSGLYHKNLDAAQSETSVDLAAYMEKHFGSNPQTSVVSASEDLGAVAARLLKAAGIELGADERVGFSLKEDGSGLYISGLFEDSYAVQDAVDSALQKNPDMLQAFKDEYNRVALSDTGALGGAYSDGTRSVEYGDVQRSFTYSADEPSAVVMTDTVVVKVTGYNYQKKVSDSFDTSADFHTLNDGGVRFTNNNGRISIDPEAYAENQAIREKMTEDIHRALETGEKIEGSMTRAEYDAVREARGIGFQTETGVLSMGGFDPNAKLYRSAPADDAEQEARAAEAKQALQDLEADPGMRAGNAEGDCGAASQTVCSRHEDAGVCDDQFHSGIAVEHERGAITGECPQALFVIRGRRRDASAALLCRGLRRRRRKGILPHV